MRWLTVGILLVGLAAGGAAAVELKIYGSGVGPGATVTPLELLAAPGDYVDQKVRVEGRIDEVCPRRGCWIDIVDENEKGGKAIRFKVEDDVITFPVDVEGKHVIAEGVFVKQELTQEAAVRYARHLAEERGETFDPASVTGPMTLYRIEGAGAVVRIAP